MYLGVNLGVIHTNLISKITWKTANWWLKLHENTNFGHTYTNLVRKSTTIYCQNGAKCAKMVWLKLLKIRTKTLIWCATTAQNTHPHTKMEVKLGGKILQFEVKSHTEAPIRGACVCACLEITCMLAYARHFGGLLRRPPQYISRGLASLSEKILVVSKPKSSW